MRSSKTRQESNSGLSSWCRGAVTSSLTFDIILMVFAPSTIHDFIYICSPILWICKQQLIKMSILRFVSLKVNVVLDMSQINRLNDRLSPSSLIFSELPRMAWMRPMVPHALPMVCLMKYTSAPFCSSPNTSASDYNINHKHIITEPLTTQTTNTSSRSL